MADRLTYELVSPERMLASGEADIVTIPGAEGDMGVMVGHAPVMSSLRPGLVDIVDEGNSTKIFVRGGFAEVTPEGLTVLAAHAIPLADLDVSHLDQQIKNAEEDVTDAKDDATRDKAQLALSQLKELRAAFDR